MSARVLVGVAITCMCMSSAQTARAQQHAGIDVVTLLNESHRFRLAQKAEEAKAKVEEALALATKGGDRVGIAMSYREMGEVYQRTGMSGEAISWYDKALKEFEALGDLQGVVTAMGGLTAAAAAVGDTAKAREYGARALKLLEESRDDRIRMSLLLMLIQSGTDPKRNPTWNNEMLDIATRVGDQSTRAYALGRRGNEQFNSGDYVSARASYEQAITGWESLGDIEALAASHLSLGRVFRAHGDYEGAIERYQKAIDLLAPTSQRYTIVEATNAKAIALGNLNRTEEALGVYREGLTLAHQSKNPALIDFMEGNLAGGLLTVKRYEEAIPLLQAVIAKKPTPYIASFRYAQLGGAFRFTGRFAEALEPVNEAIRLRRELKLSNELQMDLVTRASVLSALGRFEDALTDAREALAIVEQIRNTVLPSDFLKRGYNERVNSSYAWMVNALSRLGRGSEALEVNEQGRSRAFLDLLAGRESSDPALATPGPGVLPQPSGADLASEALGKPLDAAGISRTAGRLKSTILNYWVVDDAVLIWVVRPGLATAHVRVPVASKKLGDLVAATTAALRGTSGATATRGVEGPEAAQVPDDDLMALPMRGLGVIALAGDDKSAWRELYKTLIDPVRAQLPARGSRLTIVPHGPLFQLSFAALQSTAGRYLVEDYELAYAPAISVLDFTGRRQQETAATKGPWTIVGNPQALPSIGSRPLQRLPGAEREIATIAAIAPKGSGRLEGAGADEAALGRALNASHPSVLHFATHGFVFDDPKKQPFLALNRRSDKAAEDGRLTLDEVYGLTLNTDLVVLSACRSGSGRISSDGVIGLTRGFFYAGSPSVLATFWDVVDESTERLMSGFYRQYVKSHAKGASLRSAQLALLADLRAGKVIVTAGGREVTLPEHPLLWAAFFLSGEP